MKLIKKLFTAVAAIAMALLTTTVVSAAGTGSITITPPDGLDASASNTYVIYKVFDADGNGSAISYKLKSNHTDAPAGFTVDGQGNVSYTGTGTGGQLTEADIAAIKNYVTDDDKVQTVTATGTTPVVVSGLENGYYYVTTTTGTAVVINSTNPDVAVKDKNTVPTVDKKITDASSYDADGKKALAQVGTTVKFSSTIKVGAGAQGYVYHDTMTTGLEYNNDVEVKVNGAVVDPSNYDTTPTAAGDTFTVTFKDAYIATLAEGTEIVLNYSAKVTSAALSTNPAKNTATVSYGSNGSVNTTPKSETDVYNAKFTVTKKDNKDAGLAGAGFVIKNADGKYYKLENNVVTWVDDIANATEHTSDASGAVEAFTGLANGTYTLVEKTVPSGYNKAADVPFTVAEHDYTATNLEQTATVVNNPGTELPSTGGTGTMILTIIGSVLVIGVGVLLVTKKRMSA